MKTKLAFIILLSMVAVAVPYPAQETTSKPAIFVCGDSTAKNSGNGKNGEPVAGWGTPIAGFFDSEKVVIKNVGHAGTSSRTYYERDWPSILPQIKTGDFVLLVFGINDGSTPAEDYARYMSTMATDARDKGAHVYLLTVTTRNIWSNPKAKFNDATPTAALPSDYDPKQDRIERGTGNGRFTQWTKEIGQSLHLPVFDLTNFDADKYEGMGRVEVDKFYSDHNHTYLPGAEFVASSIVSGLKAFSNSQFVALLSAKGQAVETAAAKYISDNTLQIKDVPRNTQMGNPPAPDGAPGNGRYFPPVPANPALPTLWLIGDSTVRNGTLGDGSNMQQWGWGAPLVTHFDLKKINVVNRAFGGTSSRSFYAGFFWKNMKPQIKKGDFVLLQFGANDGGDGSAFVSQLRQFVDETREQGGTPIILSLTPRKAWASDGRFRRDNTTHVAWASEAAKQTNTLFVDLYELIAREYESLGPEKVDSLFAPAPTERLHTGWNGAVINARLVVAGLKELKDNPLAAFLRAR